MEITDLKFFRTPPELRKWFEKNHKKAKELWLGYYKTSSGKPSVTWSESVDQALCFGWIDGIRKSLGDESYTIRFTPRKPTSIWSNVNIKKMEELIKSGQMTQAGLDIFEKRKDHKSGIYSFEQKESPPGLTGDLLKKLKANKKAWEWYSKQGAYYRRTAAWWILSAKQEATQAKRLEQLISDSANGMKVPPFRALEKKK